MTKTTHSTQADDAKLVKLADELEADREMYEATLDGLNARIDANIAKLEGSDIDTKMAQADEEVADMATTVLKDDAADLEDEEADAAAADEEEDKLLADDELDPAATAARLTSEETGLSES